MLLRCDDQKVARPAMRERVTAEKTGMAGGADEGECEENGGERIEKQICEIEAPCHPEEEKHGGHGADVDEECREDHEGPRGNAGHAVEYSRGEVMAFVEIPGEPGVQQEAVSEIVPETGHEEGDGTDHNG